MARSTLGLSGNIADYYRSVAYREPQLLADLREETVKLGGPSQMQISPEQGAFVTIGKQRTRRRMTPRFEMCRN